MSFETNILLNTINLSKPSGLNYAGQATPTLFYNVEKSSLGFTYFLSKDVATFKHILVFNAHF